MRTIIEPMLLGEAPGADVLDDDLAYVVGLGLITLQGGSIAIPPRRGMNSPKSAGGSTT